MDNLDQKIILITRKTRLQDLLERHNTIEQVRFTIQQRGADASDIEREHQTYTTQIQQAEAILTRFGRVHRLDRTFLPNYLFPPDAIVVAIGQDGLVANTLKYLTASQPVIGINPEPARFDGILLPFQTRDLATIIPETIANKRKLSHVTMAQAKLDDGQTLYAVNDFFIGPRSHSSARYQINQGKVSETHSSSGLIVSTGLGSTGWLQSLLAGAAGMARNQALCGGAEEMRGRGFAWDARELRFVVREPFPSRNTQTGLIFGQITPDAPLTLTSQMTGYGVIFSDGIETDFLEFNAATTATVTVAGRYGQLVV